MPTQHSEATAELIERANAVDIHSVLVDFIKVEVPESGEGKSFKTWCPFAFEHADGGTGKSYRVYSSSNSSYCFDQHGLLLPVRLVGVQHDLPYRVAAIRILERYGLFKPKPWWERRDELIRERAEREQSIGSPSYLVEALHSAMREHPAYTQRAYSPEVLAFIERELDELDTMLTSHVTPEEVRLWYRRVREQALELLGKGEEDV